MWRRVAAANAAGAAARALRPGGGAAAWGSLLTLSAAEALGARPLSPVPRAPLLGRSLPRGFAAAAADGDNNEEGAPAGAAAAAQEEGAEAEAAADDDDAALLAKLHPNTIVLKDGRRVRQRVARKHRENYEDTLGEEADAWPDAEEVVGNFNFIYDARSLVEPLDEQVHESPFAYVNAGSASSGIADEHMTPPYPGATPYINWEVNMTLLVGTDEDHPNNRKVRLFMDVEEMQANLKLSPAALERLLLLAGKRFTPAYDCAPCTPTPKGELAFVTRKYESREDGRAELLGVFTALVAEAQKAGTPEDPLAASEDYARLRADADARVAAYRQRAGAASAAAAVAG